MNPISILLVEDNPPDARYVREMLPADIYIVTLAKTLAEARDSIVKCHPQIVLLDLSLPDSHGIETFSALYDVAPSIPIIVLTGLDDETVSMQAVKSGAQDYILKKEISEYSLPRTIRYAIERKQAEQDMRRLVMFEQREEFMATLTHDLKTPLVAANRILELFAEDEFGKLAPEQAEILLQIRDGNKMLLSMIHNLIEVYRFEKDMYTVALENTDLLKVANLCIQDIYPIARHRQIEVKTECGEIEEVLADINGIRRVLQNILENAVKFTPKGGQVSVRIGQTNGTVAIEVSDTGPGISESDQQRLFQRFMRGGNRRAPGTGLGLYLCKQIIDAHKGEITCSSKEGAGTTFKICLPVAV